MRMEDRRDRQDLVTELGWGWQQNMVQGEDRWSVVPLWLASSKVSLLEPSSIAILKLDGIMLIPILYGGAAVGHAC